MDGICNGLEIMKLEQLLKLRPGTKLQVGLNFKGRLEKLEHVIWTEEADIWRVYFTDGDPVDSVDTVIEDIRLIEENSDGTPVC